jgi:hypothetical protein
MTAGGWNNTAQGQFPYHGQQVEVLFAGQLEYAIYYALDQKYWLPNKGRLLLCAEVPVLWRNVNVQELEH